MRGLRVLLLGQGRLEFDGQALTRLMAVKHQALVFYLAAVGEPVPRSRLATLLWGEVDEAAARANLRVALTRLRRWLPEVLDIDGQRVGFAPGATVWVDWRELAAALRPDATAQARATAAAAWRGPLLDGIDVAGSDEFEHWLAQARQRAQRDAVALRRELLQQCEADGSIAEAIGHARGLLEIDEADEPAHMALMRLLAARGQRTAALAQYETCRAALVERLGARPSADCYALYTRIHAQTWPRADAPLAPSDPPPAARPAAGEGGETRSPPDARPAAGGGGESRATPDVRPPAIRLLGRSAELALLEERLSDPECRWLTITGPGGVGKTRLAEAAAAAFGPRFRQGTLWFSGRDEGGALRDAETLAQQVLERVGADRHERGALLLVLDNLETVAGARALAHLLQARVPGVTVLATSRTRVGGGQEWLLELGGLSLERGPEKLPASSPAARVFAANARRLAPDVDALAHADAVERICALVDGLPLALEMAAQSVRRDGVEAVAQRLAAGVPLVDPDRDADSRHHSIATVLEDSWALLDEAGRIAAIRLAWLPAEADVELAAAIGVDDAALALLRDHSWLKRTGGSRFALHPLQQDFLRRRTQASALQTEVREALVRHLLATLPAVEPFGDLSSESSGFTHTLASRAACSAPVLAEATAQLCADASADELARSTDRIVALLAAMDRQAEAAEVLATATARADLPRWQVAGWYLRRAELLNGIGASVAAQRAYVQGMRLAGLGDLEADAAPLAQTLRAFARVVGRRGWPPVGHPAREPFVRILLRGLVCLGGMLSFSQQPQPSVRAGVMANLVSRSGLGRAERQAARMSSAWGAALFGHPLVARRLASALERRRPITADRRLELFIAEGYAALKLALGQWAGLTEALDDAAIGWRALYAGRYEMEARSLAAKLAFYDGRLHEAWRRFGELTEAGMRRPGDAWRAWGPFGQAEVALCIGAPDPPEVTRLYERGVAVMTEMENIDAAYTLRRLGLAARLAWLRGDSDGAREAVLAGVAAANRIRYCGFWAHEGYAGLGDVLLALRRDEREHGGALPLLDAAWRALQPALDAHVLRFPPAKALGERLRGEQALDDGDFAAGRAALERAVAMAEAQGMRVELARACQALARGARDDRWGQRAHRLWQAMRTASAAA